MTRNDCMSSYTAYEAASNSTHSSNTWSVTEWMLRYVFVAPALVRMWIWIEARCRLIAPATWISTLLDEDRSQSLVIMPPFGAAEEFWNPTPALHELAPNVRTSESRSASSPCLKSATAP